MNSRESTTHGSTPLSNEPFLGARDGEIGGDFCARRGHLLAPWRPLTRILLLPVFDDIVEVLCVFQCQRGPIVAGQEDPRLKGFGVLWIARMATVCCRHASRSFTINQTTTMRRWPGGG